MIRPEIGADDAVAQLRVERGKMLLRRYDALRQPAQRRLELIDFTHCVGDGLLGQAQFVLCGRHVELRPLPDPFVRCRPFQTAPAAW